MWPIVTDRLVWSVGRSACHTGKPCKNCCTDRDAIGVEDSGGPRNHVLDWGPDPPWEGAILRGERGSVNYRDTLRSPVRKRLHQLRCHLGCELG